MKQVTLRELKKLAKQYNVQNNAMFQAAAAQYELQQKVLERIREAVDSSESLLTTKEYVKGRENEYINPLVRELPKHADSANRTAQVMLNIIETLGHETPPKSRLDLMRDE